MNLKIVFRIGAIVFLINALGLLFSTGTFFEMANLTMSPSLLTVGQFMGVTFLILALLYWRTPDLAGQGIASFWAAIFYFSWIVGFDNWISHCVRASIGGHCLRQHNSDCGNWHSVPCVQ